MTLGGALLLAAEQRRTALAAWGFGGDEGLPEAAWGVKGFEGPLQRVHDF